VYFYGYKLTPLSKRKCHRLQPLDETLDDPPNDRDTFDEKPSMFTKDSVFSSLELSVLTCLAHSNAWCLTSGPLFFSLFDQHTLSPVHITNNKTGKQSSFFLYT
jgi:hypothetical protein